MNKLLPDFTPLSIIRLFLMTMGFLLFWAYGVHAWAHAMDWRMVAGVL